MKDSVRKTIGYWLGAVLLFALFLAGFGLWRNRQQPDKTSDILILGDSIFAYVQDDTSVGNRLAEKLGLTVQDASFGGTAAAYLDRDARLGHTQDGFSLAALVRALTMGDFRVQRNARVNLIATEYYEDRLAELEKVDLSGVKTLLIDHCVNDYQAGIPVRDEDDPYNEYTYEGALRYGIETLRKAYPDLRIVLVSPTAVWYWDLGESGSQTDHGGGCLDDYVEAQRRIAEETGVEWVDLYHDLYPDQETNLAMTDDGLHPNETGRDTIAEALAEYLR